MSHDGDMDSDQDQLEGAPSMDPGDRPGEVPEAESDPNKDSSTPPTNPTPIKSSEKSTPAKSTPRSKKRKSRTPGYGDESDSDYRAQASSRISSRSRRRASFDCDPDGDYGGSLTPTRKMTRPIKSRYSYRKMIKDVTASGSELDVEEEDEYEDKLSSICLKSCPYYETEGMLECAGAECDGRKFHPGCVGFRVKPPSLGKGKWWFCFECRKVEERGMKTNGVYVEGEEASEVEVVDLVDGERA